MFFLGFLWEYVGLITWVVGEGSSKGVVIVVQQHVVHRMQFELTHKCMMQGMIKHKELNILTPMM